MCRVLAYIGPEVPVESLLLTPENSLVNQSLDPERHPQLQLAGWGFGIWSEHLLKPDEPLLYHRPMAAFYDDNAPGIVPSLQTSTLLAHVRAAVQLAKLGRSLSWQRALAEADEAARAQWGGGVAAWLDELREPVLL